MPGEESPPTECKECHYNARCIHRECVCKTGYTGDGFDCRRKYLHAARDFNRSFRFSHNHVISNEKNLVKAMFFHTSTFSILSFQFSWLFFSKFYYKFCDGLRFSFFFLITIEYNSDSLLIPRYSFLFPRRTVKDDYIKRG